MAKRRIATRLGPPATEGTQNLLCADLAIAVFAGLAANTLRGAWCWTAWSRSASRAGRSSKDGEPVVAGGPRFCLRVLVAWG